ncbi:MULTISPECIES: CaiB/BaiF CoA-transferase family protein [Delftia]|uniref:CaiB/BaiF CoA transferase family protein n=1 Tax=Delftia sp. UME58 TaxID=1862322 RepID=UPI0016012205|nr:MULTISPECIES: CaiB/BaiF CoA-transferase family protein [Delftia]MBB1652815.1 formyl-CoA transferase [Delftia sp. UME58]
MQPLKGMKVVDLSKVLAGPLCGQYLGNLGAEVIKVEPIGVGDDTRHWLPQREGQSATFLAVNHNKQSLAVDLKSPQGQAVVHRLVAEADIALQGFGAGTAEKLGVDHATLHALNPRLIYCDISGYGRDGPLGQESGYDVMLQAFCGMVAVMGDPGGPMVRATFSPVDLGTGMMAFGGVLAAVVERMRTGQGVLVEVSLLDTAMGFMGYLAQNYWCSGKLPQRMGTAHPAMAPYQVFEASDGPVMIGVGNDSQWQRFCPVAGLEPWQEDVRFATNAARVAHFSETVALVQQQIGRQSVTHWVQRLQAVGVPCSPIQTLAQALEHPQLKQRQVIGESVHPTLGPLPSVNLPITFNHAPRGPAAAPPLLGQHTRQILRGARYGDTEIDALLANRIVATTE